MKLARGRCAGVSAPDAAGRAAAAGAGRWPGQRPAAAAGAAHSATVTDDQGSSHYSFIGGPGRQLLKEPGLTAL